MNAITNYLLHIVLAIVLIVIFIWVYTAVTPIDEFLLIRQGNNAAALSLGGALIGFSLTIASVVIHTNDYREFLAWAAGAMIIQLLVYAVTTLTLRMSKEHIESGNTAFGGLMGAISIAVGAVNAACVS